MKSSIYQGKNISQLPLTHCGSLYLFPEFKNIGLNGIARFENYINRWGKSNSSIELILGSIEKGKQKAINHVQWVASCSDDFIQITKDFMRPKAVCQTIQTRRVKIENSMAISGYSDTVRDVICTKLTSRNTLISIEQIIDPQASAIYSFKFVDYGLNTIYFIKKKT